MLLALQGGASFSSFSQQYLDSVLVSIETPNLFIKQNLKNMLSSAICFPHSIFDYNKKNISSIEIYPNPFNKSTTIVLNKKVINAKLYMCDIEGNLLKTKWLKNNNVFVIEIGDEISSGIYFITVVENSKIIGQDKIILLK
jgi:hypothetical protein